MEPRPHTQTLLPFALDCFGRSTHRGGVDEGLSEVVLPELRPIPSTPPIGAVYIWRGRPPSVLPVSPMKPDPTRLIFGTNPLSTMPSRRSVFRLLEAVVDAGVRHFDTARAYGRGYSEVLVGEFLRAHRVEVRLTAKVGMGETHTERLPSRLALPLNHWRKKLQSTPPAETSAPPARPARPRRLDHDYIETSLAETLDKLGVAAVDTLLLHENLPTNLEDRTLAFLLGLKAGGTVGRLGVGTNARTLEAHYEEVEGFTVLQYEGGGEAGLPDLLARFPEATHFQHGFLRRLGEADPAAVLAAAQQANPGGQVLFSTRSTDRLRADLGAPVA